MVKPMRVRPITMQPLGNGLFRIFGIQRDAATGRYIQPAEMPPNQCSATLHGERCAHTAHEGPHTFETSMAEAAAAQILDSLTPDQLTTLEAAWHATGDVQTAMQETLKGAQP